MKMGENWKQNLFTIFIHFVLEVIKLWPAGHFYLPKINL